MSYFTEGTISAARWRQHDNCAMCGGNLANGGHALQVDPETPGETLVDECVILCASCHRSVQARGGFATDMDEPASDFRYWNGC